ncbi:DUF4159 domain-containing protein [Candidatus Poribacteria bacterium]|nr:DUF4159 domain-containing protein [Candidatus Poribacteria bacterium]
MSFPMFADKLSIVGQWMSGKLSLVSLEVTAYALIVWIILRVVRFRSAKVREIFWLIVLFKMVFSLFIALPISFSISSQRLTSKQILKSSARPAEQAIRQPQIGSASATSSTQAYRPSRWFAGSRVFSVDEMALWRQINWQQRTALRWLSGCGLMLGRLALGLRTLGKLRKNTYPAPEYMQRMLCSCKEQLKIHSVMKLQLADNIAAPMLCGFLRPVIMLPGWCIKRFSQPELRLMLIHELAHWKYRDTWILFAKRLIEAIFFFHPVVWYAGKQAVKEAEVACDELVVALSRESTTYTNCLMQFLQQAAGMKQRALGGLAAGGNVSANRIRKLLKEGSKMISTKIKPQTIIALVLVALLGLPSWFVVRGGSAETASSTEAVSIVATDKPLGEYEYGAVVWGQGKDIKGEVHISDISYSSGNFWFHGLPAYLEKWMNARSQVQVNFIAQGGKSVYLSWPPEDWPQERIQEMSKYVDPEGLFKQPMLLMSRLLNDMKVDLSQAEIENLRKYLIEKGGFLFIDDDMGETGAFYQSIRAMLRHAFPEFPIMPIPNDHEIYRCFYEMIDRPPVGSISWLQRKSKKDYLEGIFIEGRLAALISDRDYWNSLIGRGPYSPGVLRFCTNMVIYAITHGGISDYSKYKP